MSQDNIVVIRRQVKQVPSMLRQNQLVPAAQSISNALRLMLTKQLLKAERDEFEEVLAEGLDYLNNDKALRQLYPLALEYAPGEEKRLFEDVRGLIEALAEDATSKAAEIARAMEIKKNAALEQGQSHLDAKEYDQARSVFSAITNEFPDDAVLKGAIGEKVLAAGLYEDAAEYLSEAVRLDPQALHLYNRLGIALRKLGRFDSAEENYKKALHIAPDDPNLMFNVGRLYAEWNKWAEALEYGEKAHALNPDFAEAKKLADFARKKL